MEKEKKRRMVFGPMGGICEALVMQPFDTIKVRRQSNQYIGLSKTIRQYGISNLYKGLTPFMGQMSVKYALRFGTFELLRGKSDVFYKNFAAGMTAGCVESLFITPFELIKTNLQTRDSIADPISAIKRVKYEKGIKGMYRGFASTCLRQSINQGSNFTIYLKLREKIIKPGEKPNIPMVMGAALISGSAGPLLNNPFDVVKTRYMNPGFDNKYNGIFDCCQKIIRTEGISSLYKGLGLRLFRVSCGQAITFSVIEQLSHYADQYKFLI